MMYSPILKRSSKWVAACLIGMCAHGRLIAQPSTPKESIPSVGASWTTYNGDNSGRRYSTLKQINRRNVYALAMAWAFPARGSSIKGTPLLVDGVLYVTAPEKVWALDASSGQQIWAYSRPSSGNHLAQRGVAYFRGRVYFGTPDAHLICLDAHTGNVIWDEEIADVKFGYYLSGAPLVVKGRILIGTSGDQTNVPHFLEARDWETGAKIWRTDSLPKPNTPAAATWPNEKVLSTGGSPMWLTGTVDEKQNLLYWGTGNPHPVLDGQVREGANLYTDCILALNPDTGALVWYFDASPHDTHDWDAVETPVLFDGSFKGRPRKMLAQASRNGYFFVLDRLTGEALLSTQFVKSNWTTGIDAKGSPIPDPAKEPQSAGSLVSSATGGATNWMPPSFDPRTGLFYVAATKGYSYWYLALDQKGLPQDHQGGGALTLPSASSILALDYHKGKARWEFPGGEGRSNSGILTTAGNLLFSGDASGNLLALDASTGKALWHVRPGGNLTNGPMTYEAGGRQYLVTAVDDMLYAWALPSHTK